MEKTSKRIFIGLALPQQLREVIAKLQVEMNDMRWVNPKLFHITLHFLGEIDASGLTYLKRELSALTFPIFTLKPKQVGYFSPAIIWAGIEANSSLESLHQALGNILKDKLGLGIDTRPFIPHITIGRGGSSCSREAVDELLHNHSNWEEDVFEVDAFHIYESHYRDGAVEYKIISSYPLSKPTT